MDITTSPSASTVKGPQVFINFRGLDLRNNFISHMERAFTEHHINYYIDKNELRSKPTKILFERIKESKIALAIFSENYADSEWCLDELVEIMKNVKTGNLRVIPVFFKVTPYEVRMQNGEYAVKLYGEGRRKRPKIPEWEDALASVPDIMGLILPEKSSEDDFLLKIVKAVKEVEAEILSERGGGCTNLLSANRSTLAFTSGESSSATVEQTRASLPRYGVEQQLKQLEERLDFTSTETRIVGILGMAGTGKTTLAELHFNAWKKKFLIDKMFKDIHEKSQNSKQKEGWLMHTLLEGPENVKAEMSQWKIFLVLDDVSDKSQVEFLHKNVNLIKNGSKIVITARDSSSIAELVHDTYVVPGLNDKEALELFRRHAFKDQVSSTEGNFMKLSREFVDYAGGNPRALEELGKELCGENEKHWEERLATLPHRCNPTILAKLKISYDKLSDQQMDVFLDIACFFRSEEEDYVKCLLDTYDPESGEAVRELAEKLLICISAGRVEMHNLLCTLGKELGSSDGNKSGERMWNHDKITNTLRSEQNSKEIKEVRGIFLDTSKVDRGIPIHPKTFIKKFNKLTLRYLKIYDSLCPQQCKFDGKVHLPEGLEFPLQEIRYLHWLKFPLVELPPDFNPENLIDLRLPYSKIKRVWEAVKEVPRLKWVDLSYSTDLTDLSALCKAYNLQRLNLEGCTKLVELREGMKNMERLVFLNLRGCVELCSLPRKLKLISLKTLILSGCTKFNNFELIFRNLEFLHLDGTAIECLPPTIRYFQKLELLNLRNCKMLESLPDCLDKLKALEELILSGCSRLTSFPEIKENMEKMQILLIDGTSIEEVPKMLFDCDNNSIDQGPVQRLPRTYGLCMLRRLCLSRNDRISSLESCISQLYNLKWIDLRYCTNLTSLLELPPNLQYLNAHACISLKTVASPLALLMPTEQSSSSFIFTNCEKLKQVAKNEIICYAHKKSLLLSDALNRQYKGLAFETLVASCFPGSEVPAWFNHKACGAVLEPELPPHLTDNGFIGIALCAVVSFQNYKIQNNNFMVKCICELNNGKRPSSFFSFHIGDLSETCDEQQCTIKSTHVFLGFTSWVNINQCQEVDVMKGCDPTRAYVRFEVTDGTSEAAKCEVLKCGFSLLCESDYDSLDANADGSSMVSESGNGNLDYESDNSSLHANADASSMVSESGNSYLDYESDNGSLDAYADASPMVIESGNGDLDAKADANPTIDQNRPEKQTDVVKSRNRETQWRKNRGKRGNKSHSVLQSALCKAYNLQRLNLEGCTKLVELREGMKNMERLVFLNLRGCVELCSLPRKLKLISLKTLILSGCTKFNNFELISRNLEFLHLDGTAIARLPPAIQNFPKHVLLNLRNCKNLGSLLANLYMLKALEEVILSGCSEIKSFPEIKENMEKMQILLLDGTSIEEVPKMLFDCGNNFMAICRFFYQGVFQRPPRPNGLSMLRRLCLSRNDSLESCITQLYHLRWIDLRYCTSLRALLTLPPNLEYLNAHGCISLKTVASPLALLMPTEQVSSSFIFTNCEKLEQVAKNEIICYAHKKSQLLSDALNRQNKGIACETLVATCFPGSVVPAWFNHRASGAVLEPELPPYWSDNRFVGIALCTVVSFQDYAIQNNNFKVKCICEINNEETSSSFFNFHIGDLSEPYDDKQQSTVKSAHVFIGFTSWLNITQCQEVVPTKASIRFEVTDGTCEAAKYEVVKCGFSLVCESDNGSWDATQMSRESNHVSIANASSTVSESGNGSRRDTNVVISPGREEGNQGAMSSILSFLRERNLRLFD